MRNIKWVPVLLATVCVCACSKKPVSDNQYYLKKSGQVAPIVVPPGVPAIKQQTYYPVPRRAVHTTNTVSLVPPTLQ